MDTNAVGVSSPWYRSLDRARIRTLWAWTGPESNDIGWWRAG
jgi:hypothetical protein